eukprot:jgi/Botrbrau1/22212/Bobra.168_1s0043.1
MADENGNAARCTRRDIGIGLSAISAIVNLPKLHFEIMLASLNDALICHDYHRAAGILGVLLVARDYQSTPRDQHHQRAAFQGILKAGWSILHRLRESRGISAEVLERYLRTLKAHGKGEEVQTEVCMLYAESYNPQRGYELLNAYKMVGTSLKGQRRINHDYTLEVCCALLLHKRWSIAVQEFWKAAGAKEEGTDLDEDLFAAEKLYYKKGRREAQELWADIEAHLSKAWVLRPTCTELTFLLVQMYVVAEKSAKLLQMAPVLQKQLSGAEGDDPDKRALLLALGLAVPRGPSAMPADAGHDAFPGRVGRGLHDGEGLHHGEGGSGPQHNNAFERYDAGDVGQDLTQAVADDLNVKRLGLEILQQIKDCPDSQQLMLSLIQLHSQYELAPGLVVEALLLFLDTQGGVQGEETTYAWFSLTDALCMCAESLPPENEWGRTKPAQIKEDQLGPSLPVTMEINEGCALPDADEALSDKRTSEWARMQQLLCYRASWWRQLHFCSAWEQRDESHNPCEVAILVYKALVAAFMLGPDDRYPCEVAERVRKASKGWRRLKRQQIDGESCPELALPGHDQHEELSDGDSELWTRLEELEKGLALAASAFLQHLRKMFSNRVQTDDCPGQEDGGLGQTSKSDEFGALQNLPDVWWRSFPSRRRQLRKCR